jgi:hypothetical protein
MARWRVWLGVAALAGCGLLRLEVEQEASTTVQGAGLLGGLLRTLDLGALDDFDLTVEEALADQGVEPGDLRSVTLTAFVLRGDPDLGFLSGLEVSVSADGVAPVVVATTGDVPDGATEVALDLPAVDLADAITAGGLRFSIAASGDLPVDDTAITARVGAEVVATPQGACRAAGRD